MDNEIKLAEQLKQNIPQTPPPSGGTTDPLPAEPGEVDLWHQLAPPMENAVLKQQLADYYNLPPSSRLNGEVQANLETILEWAVNTSGSKDFAEVLRTLGRKEGELGIRHKTNKLGIVQRYIKLTKQMDGLNEQRKALYGG